MRRPFRTWYGLPRACQSDTNYGVNNKRVSDQPALALPALSHPQPLAGTSSSLPKFPAAPKAAQHSLMTFSRPPHARARPASHGGCQEPVALPQHSLPLSTPPQLQQLAGSLPPWHNRVVLGQGEGGRAARALPGPLVRHALDLRRWGGWWGRRWGGGTHKHGRGDMAMWATT